MHRSCVAWEGRGVVDEDGLIDRCVDRCVKSRVGEKGNTGKVDGLGRGVRGGCGRGVEGVGNQLRGFAEEGGCGGGRVVNVAMHGFETAMARNGQTVDHC